MTLVSRVEIFPVFVVTLVFKVEIAPVFVEVLVSNAVVLVSKVEICPVCDKIVACIWAHVSVPGPRAEL